MSLNIYVNTGSVDDELNVTGTTFTEFSSGNDKLIFTAGSPEVISGGDIPTEAQLISAGVQLTGSEIIVDDYLMLDASANLLRGISLMGNHNKRYVLAFSFNSSTASEPVLEVWDDIGLDTITSIMLGAGTPSQSYIRGITTTSALPGSDWVGSRLAGSSAGNYLELNDGNGILTGADVLYANLKVVVPSSRTTGFSNAPVFVVKYLDN